MEFPDLSPYEFLWAPIPMRSIGWLGCERGIQGGPLRPMSDVDLQRVLNASTRLVSVTLGYHDCEFCSGESVFRGNGEYHYYLNSGEAYSAPALILHYIMEHNYRPPEEFLEGLRVNSELVWDARAERLCEVLADELQDFELRCQAISELPHWRDRRAFDALLHAIRDEELDDVLGEELGRALASFMDCEFAADSKPSDLPQVVRFGMCLKDPDGIIRSS
ncbi:HEAT repeat domain-containing protein [Actinoplanes sp. NPDC026623]|uniref:HEAT repeat domain-containing protein n=1 Tax=Actinoplanes sp. NPDC026623 TaxID=3155610 RepID=UPI003400E3FF